MNINDMPSASRAWYDRVDRLRKELLMAGQHIEEYDNDELVAFLQAALPIVTGAGSGTTAVVSNGQSIATSDGGAVVLTVAGGSITQAVYTAPAG